MTSIARPAWQLARPEPIDVGLGLALTAVVALGAFQRDGSVAYDIASPGAWLVVLFVLSTVSLCWRRHYPVTVFAVITTVTFLLAGLSWETSLLPFVVLFATYNLGAHTETRRSAAALGCGLIGTGALFAVEAPFFDSVLGLAFPAEMVLLWGLGLAVARRERAADRARDQLVRVEREAVVRSERAVLEERMRVARDLHDLVSSSLSAIAVQAAAARPGSDSALEVLSTIETINHVALQDLRRLLRALRLPPSADNPSAENPVPSERTLEEAQLRSSLAKVTGWSNRQTDFTAASTTTSVLWDRSVDLALGLTVVAINLVGSLAPDPSTTTRYEAAVVPVLVLLASAPGLALVVRRTHPEATLAITFLALTAVTAAGWQTGTLPAALLIALYAIGAWASPRRGLLAVSAVAAAMVAMAVVGHDRFAEWVQWGSFGFVAPYLAGVVIGHRRLQAQRVLDAVLEAEREAVRKAERAVAAERLAVARDLHDLVTHSLAAVAVLASTHADVSEAAALHRIQDASRRALTDLRAMLSSLRTADNEAHLAPAPGLKELVDLTSLHSAIHGPVRLDLDERVATEAPSLRTTVFRIVQEALTNAGRHSPGAPVEVCVRHTEAGVSVRVQNESPPSKTTVGGTGSGWGLVGMHERVELYGGNLVARATHEGGFEVAAELFRAAPP